MEKEKNNIPRSVFAGNRFWRGVKWTLLYLFCLAYAFIAAKFMESPFDAPRGSIVIPLEWPIGMIRNLLAPALVYTAAFALAKHAGKELLREQAAESVKEGGAEDGELLNRYQAIFARGYLGGYSFPITRNWPAYVLWPVYLLIYWFFTCIVLGIVVSVMGIPLKDNGYYPSGVYLTGLYTMVLLGIFQHAGWWLAGFRAQRQRLWPFIPKRKLK